MSWRFYASEVANLWSFRQHRSVPEIHQRLVQRGVSIAQRTVTDLLERYARVGGTAPGR